MRQTADKDPFLHGVLSRLKTHGWTPGHIRTFFRALPAKAHEYAADNPQIACDLMQIGHTPEQTIDWLPVVARGGEKPANWKSVYDWYLHDYEKPPWRM